MGFWCPFQLAIRQITGASNVNRAMRIAAVPVWRELACQWYIRLCGSHCDVLKVLRPVYMGEKWKVDHARLAYRSLRASQTYVSKSGPAELGGRPKKLQVQETIYKYLRVTGPTRVPFEIVFIAAVAQHNLAWMHPKYHWLRPLWKLQNRTARSLLSSPDRWFMEEPVNVAFPRLRKAFGDCVKGHKYSKEMQKNYNHNHYGGRWEMMVPRGGS